MRTFIQKRIHQILLLTFVGFLTNCQTNELDLSHGINTQMTIGGDSLSLPIGKIKPVQLGSLVDSLGASILNKSTSGTYSIRLKDSLEVQLNSINPVTVSLNPISIPAIQTNVASLNFPTITINPIALNSTVNIPVANTSSINIPTINSSTTASFTFTTPSPVKGYKVTSPTYVTFGPYESTASNSVNQNVSLTFDNVLQKINTIYFKNSVVTVTFDKTQINNLGFVSQNDTLKSFRIDYPSTFKLSGNTGQGTSIQGSSFIIKDALLPSNINTFTFTIQSLDLSGQTQNGSLSYASNIPYSVDYKFIGKADQTTSITGKSAGVTVSLSAAPQLSDLDMVTNPIVLASTNGSNGINQTINNLPIQVNTIKSLNFQSGAALQLQIANPGIAPFSFTAGTCTVNLPTMMVFQPYPGLNTSTNVLTIPYSDLFSSKTIGIAGMNINKTVVNQSITVNDALSYTLSGLTVGSAATKLSTTQSMGSKAININASLSGLTVKDASVTTNQIAINIPNQKANIAINQLVSTDVKKLYSIALKTPTTITLNIGIQNLPTSIDSVFFNNYAIKLPAAMKFANGDVNSSNEIILNRGFKVSSGFTKTITLDSLDFGTNGISLQNGYFVFNDSVTLSGGAYIKSTTLSSADLSTVTISPKITIGSLPVSEIQGQISPTIDPINQSVKLNLPNVLKDPANNLDFVNPVITLEFGNTMGIPLDVALQLIPKRNGTVIPNATISTNLTIAAAASLGNYTWSQYWLATNTTGVTTGFTPIVLTNLPNLLRTIPDEIDISATATVSGTRQIVDLYSLKNALKVRYSVNVPLDFGQDFKILYTDTIKNLKQSLNQYLNVASEIDLVAVVSNGIPLDLNLTMVPLDVNNNVVSGITMNSNQTIHSCDINGNPQISTILLGIKETQTGALANLNAIKFTIQASKNATVAGIPLKSDQTVALELRVKVPHGITLNPSK